MLTISFTADEARECVAYTMDKQRALDGIVNEIRDTAESGLSLYTTDGVTEITEEMFAALEDAGYWVEENESEGENIVYDISWA